MKKKFDLKKEYKESWKFLKESRKFIYAIIFIFLIFILIGSLIPVPSSISEQILNFIREILEKTKDMSAMELGSFIFLNNLKSSFYGMFFGILLGLFPIISSIGNGYILGFIASIAVKEEGILSLWRILPHGIFELPAVFISLGLGLRLGTFIFTKNKIKTLKNYFYSSLKAFLIIVIPLLLIAGIIEGSLIFFLR